MRVAIALASYSTNTWRQIVQSVAVKIRGVDDVISFIDSCPGIPGRAGIIWWLALGGLFLDAFSNSALSAGLGPMARDLHLDAAQIALMTSFASWVAIAFNPIGGWMADRWGRVRPLVLAKCFAVAGAVLVMFAPGYAVILAGRFFVGMAYGIDFAIAMAMLAEFTPAHLKSRLNAWQGMWYTAVCLNLVLALLFHAWQVGDSIWRYSIAATAIFAGADDIAAIGTARPGVAAADRTLEAVVIGAGGIGPVLAIHVAGDGVAGQAAQKGAADQRAAIAMGDGAAQHATGDGAQDGAAGVIAAAALVGKSAGDAQGDQDGGGKHGLTQHGKFLPGI